MRTLIALLLLSALAATPAFAKAHTVILSGNTAYTKATKPGTDIPALCKDTSPSRTARSRRWPMRPTSISTAC